MKTSPPNSSALDVRSAVSDSVTPRTVARQAPVSMGFCRQEYWSGLPCPPPGDLPDPEIKSASLKSPALAGRFFTTNATWEAPKGDTVTAQHLVWSWIMESMPWEEESSPG